VLSTNRNGATTSVADVVRDLGCNTKYSKEKAANVFDTKYKNKMMTAKGVLEVNDNGTLGLKLLNTTLTYDLQIYLSDKNQAYNVEKGQVVAVRFTMKRSGGCFLPFSGDHGVIIQQ
jgi:hypothetical protein